MRKEILFTIFPFLVLYGCTGDKDQPDAYGTFEATEVTVSSLANGRLLQFDIEEGQQVDSGMIVGYVDTVDLHLKSLQAVDQRSATLSRIADLESQIAVQEQNKENLLVDKRRVERLLKDGAATQKQMDDINAAINVAERQIASIRSQFTGVGSQAAGITQQIAQLQEAIKNSRIVNPLKGTVLAKYAEKDEVTAYGKPLYKIADLREIILRVYISGTQIPHIRIGDTVNVGYDKDEKTNTNVKGVVSWISQTAEFTPKTIQTKEERVNLVYALKVRVKNDGSLKIGMPGEIKLINP